MAAIGEDEGDGDGDDGGGELQLSGNDLNSGDGSTYVLKVIMVSSNLRFYRWSLCGCWQWRAGIALHSIRP